MEKRIGTINYSINLSFFLYFIILLSERLLSVILSLSNGMNIYNDPFNGYVYTITFISIVGWLIFLLFRCRNNIKSLFKLDNCNIEFKNLCIASGILLLSGMVHTEYTNSILQFISYGILIIGILLKVIINNKTNNNKPLLWLSFIYLVSFSMAIPVMYRSLIELHVMFHILEATASIILVIIFTYLMIRLFNDNNDLFNVVPLLIMLIFDIALIVMRWNEEINWFILIFASLTSFIFLMGLIFKKKQNN